MAYLEKTVSGLSIEFSHLQASHTVGSVRRYGFQSSCKIKNLFMFSQHIPFHFTLFLTSFTSVRLMCFWFWFWLCVTHIPVSKLCKSKKGQLKWEWMAEVSLGSLALFPCCCTVELSWIYCIFFFFEGEVEGDIYCNIVMIIWKL